MCFIKNMLYFIALLRDSLRKRIAVNNSKVLWHETKIFDNFNNFYFQLQEYILCVGKTGFTIYDFYCDK